VATNPGFGTGKMAGLPGFSGSGKPRFQTLHEILTKSNMPVNKKAVTSQVAIQTNDRKSTVLYNYSTLSGN